MAQLNEEFSVDTLPQGNGGFDPIPAGWYMARITQAGVQKTKDSTGEYIKLRLDVLGPSHQGRVLFANLNIRNQSAKAEEIGRQQLGEVMRAIGLARVNDTDQLIGGELSIKVDVKNDDYGPGNEVKGYKAINGSSAPAAAASSSAAAPAQSAAPAGKSVPPWMKK